MTDTASPEYPGCRHRPPRRRLERRNALFGKRCEQYGIACFPGDELEIMRIAFGRLHECGRRKIAMITIEDK